MDSVHGTLAPTFRSSVNPYSAIFPGCAPVPTKAPISGRFQAGCEAVVVTDGWDERLMLCRRRIYQPQGPVEINLVLPLRSEQGLDTRQEAFD